MCIKLLSLVFLIYLSSTYCSECTDKTTFEEGEDEYSACHDLSGENYMCHYNKEKGFCEELTCDNSPPKQCYNIPSITVDGVVKKCIRKSDKTGCEYKSCEDLTFDCGRFDTGEDDKICTLNSETNVCEIKSCSSLTENCEQLIPFNYKDKKCALISEGHCGIKNKDCEEYDISQCEKWGSNEGEPLERCEYNPTLKKCTKFTCEELSNTECSKFAIYEENKVCAPFGDKCKIQSCEEISPDICETVEFDFPGDKCVKTDSVCTLKRCEDTDPSECENFIPVNKAYKCVLNSYSGRCQWKYKECEELSEDECDAFNIHDNLERTDGKKCVEEDGQCTLNSNKLEISVFIAFIFFILF